MSEKKDNNKLETARDAALGYTTIVLTAVCFLIALVAIIVAVRFVVGLAPTPTSTVTQGTVATTVRNLS